MILGQEADDPNTPEDDRIPKIVPGPLTIPGTPPSPPPPPSIFPSPQPLPTSPPSPEPSPSPNPSPQPNPSPSPSTQPPTASGEPPSPSPDPAPSPQPPAASGEQSSPSPDPSPSPNPSDPSAQPPSTSQSPEPLDSKSVVIDSNVAIALNKAAKGERLQPKEQAMLNRIAAMGNVELRVTDTTVAEVKDGVITFKRVPVAVERSSPEYQALLQQLESANVVRGKGVNDRAIVADTFFAQTEPGVKPTLATHDDGVYKPLARMAEIKPEKLGKTVPEAFPSGFNVTVNGKTIRVIPIPKK